jgi:hypothetical protein
VSSWRTARSERPSLVDPARSRLVARAVLLDVACVLAFVAVGRRNHGETDALSGIADTAAPFLFGLFAGWLAVIYARRAPSSLRAGGVVVVATVVFGMVWRRTLDSGGTPPAFVLVATAVLTALLLGWRVVARWSSGR